MQICNDHNVDIQDFQWREREIQVLCLKSRKVLSCIFELEISVWTPNAFFVPKLRISYLCPNNLKTNNLKNLDSLPPYTLVLLTSPFCGSMSAAESLLSACLILIPGRRLKGLTPFGTDSPRGQGKSKRPTKSSVRF